MTRCQKQLYDRLRAWLEANGTPPTYDQMADFMQTSRGSIAAMLGRLKREGLVDWIPNAHGTLHIVQVPRPSPAGEAHLAQVARLLLANVIREDLKKGIAVVRADALGDLDIALAEVRGERAA